MDKIRMTELDILAAETLVDSVFRVGSYNKRFARNIASIARSENPELTQKQLDNLWRLVWRYRRQIRNTSLITAARIYIDQLPKPPKPVDPHELEIYQEWPKYRPGK